MLSARAFGQWNAGELDWLATTFGAGIGRLSTGMTYLTFDVGEAVGYNNETAIPHASVLLALSVPIKSGEQFGSHWEPPKTELYYGFLGGLVAPIKDNYA